MLEKSKYISVLNTILTIRVRETVVKEIGKQTSYITDVIFILYNNLLRNAYIYFTEKKI